MTLKSLSEFASYLGPYIVTFKRSTRVSVKCEGIEDSAESLRESCQYGYLLALTTCLLRGQLEPIKFTFPFVILLGTQNF